MQPIQYYLIEQKGMTFEVLTPTLGILFPNFYEFPKIVIKSHTFLLDHIIFPIISIFEF